MATNKNTQKAAEAVAETPAVTETVPETTETVPTGPKKEKIYIPRGSSNDDPNLFVSVNGVNYLLPRGKDSEVPAHIAAEIRRSWRAQDALDEHKDALLNAAK